MHAYVMRIYVRGSKGPCLGPSRVCRFLRVAGLVGSFSFVSLLVFLSSSLERAMTGRLCTPSSTTTASPPTTLRARKSRRRQGRFLVPLRAHMSSSGLPLS